MISYKNRKIDTTKTVRVYRNLHSKDDSTRYSVVQNHLVVAHTNNLHLKACTFKVSKAGQSRVRAKKQKNIHAFIIGYIIDPIDNFIGKKVQYNPYHDDFFMSEGKEIFISDYVKIDNYIWA